MAIETDATWVKECEDAGKLGMKTARAIGMITYRNYATYAATQEDDANAPLRQTKADSYIQYQGTKFMKRFNAYSYWQLTYAMDSHHLARDRNKSLEEILEGMEQQSLVIGITSDILCPVTELQFIAKHMKRATFIAIDSLYGHDGFLTETAQITEHLKIFLHDDGF
jgi:homoserine O-acetyltransferase